MFDPFCGSGTRGVASRELGCFFVGAEKEGEDAKLAGCRIGAAVRGGVLREIPYIRAADRLDHSEQGNRRRLKQSGWRQRCLPRLMLPAVLGALDGASLRTARIRSPSTRTARGRCSLSTR